jgi:hypothetical protein
VEHLPTITDRKSSYSFLTKERMAQEAATFPFLCAFVLYFLSVHPRAFWFLKPLF